MTVLAEAAFAALDADTPCHGMPWPPAREVAHAAPVRLPAGPVPPAGAVGLTLAEEIRTRRPLPGFDTAAMDGFAVAGSGPWRLRGAVRAGDTWAGGAPAVGEAVEISTGARVPAGAHAVLPVEQAVRSGAAVGGPVPEPGRHVRRAGEDAPAGACLAPSGTRIGPALLGLAAACGYDVLCVRPRPRVRVGVTGDDVVRAGQPGPGQVRDALGPMLPPLVNVLGGAVTGLRHMPDRPAGLLADAVDAAPDEADVVVVTGSTSVGVTDQLRGLLAGRGARRVVDTVACRPGHPQVPAGLGGNRWLVGLPGNPCAAPVAAHILLAPLLAGLTGHEPNGVLCLLYDPPVSRPVLPLPVPVVPAGSGLFD